MARVIWKGSISFGLVHVPIALYSGEEREELDLTLLDRRDLSPVGYKRYNKNTEQDVSADQIVKGYEYEKGQYVLLGEEEFREANVDATQTIEIVDFVAAAAVPVMYFDRPYYLEPLKRGEKGYGLLREILRRTGRVGIAKVVLRTREYIAAVLPYDKVLVLDLLRYAHELRQPRELNVPGEDLAALGIRDKEIELGERLVESMVSPWQPEKYHDEYRDDLMRVIEAKIEAGETKVLYAPKPVEMPRGAEIIDLMAALKRSVAETEKTRGKAQAEGKVRGGGGRKRA